VPKAVEGHLLAVQPGGTPGSTTLLVALVSVVARERLGVRAVGVGRVDCLEG